MRVVIVGAGPSGLMCAIAAARNHHQVFILEKNEKPGKKIYITGKGRCNVTNYCSVNETVNHIVHNGKFLYSALNQFSSTDVMDFFEKRGVKLVIERGNRVFPSSYKASDITRSLTKECEKLGVRIYCHTNITKIEKIDDHFHLEYNKNLFIDADKLVIATGGNSYPLTGSTGDGYLIAKQFSHHIVDIMPGLVALKVSDKVSYDAQGLTLKNVGLHAYNDQVHYVENGEMLFEKGMIDGPIVLKISSLINDKKNIRLYLDLKIGLTLDEVDARLVRDFLANPTLSLKDELKSLIPVDMIKDFLERIKMPPNVKLSQIRKEQRNKIAQYLKRYDLNYLGLGSFDRAIITRGGVDVKEINQKTMESKLVNNLYFIGEVLDVDAFTGGFNMQVAFSTGYACGSNIK